MQFFKVNDMWFDFINLLLLTVYFFKFGDLNQAKNEAKISFSKTSRLEKTLRDYTKIQIDKKHKLIAKLTTGDSKPTQEISKAQKEKAETITKVLTDGQEEFLGPTYYLIKLKRKIFIYNFTKQMKVFCFVGGQIMTAVLIFILAVLHRSIMSIGYMVICTILFYNMKDFFYQEKLQRQGKHWVNPYLI